jgi:hypothetical protein
VPENPAVGVKTTVPSGPGLTVPCCGSRTPVTVTPVPASLRVRVLVAMLTAWPTVVVAVSGRACGATLMVAVAVPEVRPAPSVTR